VPPPDVTLGPDDLTDIKPVGEWPSDTALGTHSGRTRSETTERLVLLVRGAVLELYPNTLVYAVRAEWGADGARQPGDEERHPLFSVTLKPDVSCFGFDFTLDDAVGSATDPGWFLALAEHPGEPRFGLDAARDTAGQWPTRWDDLSWG